VYSRKEKGKKRKKNGLKKKMGQKRERENKIGRKKKPPTQILKRKRSSIFQRVITTEPTNDEREEGLEVEIKNRT
jgi:hypothetical protein